MPSPRPFRLFRTTAFKLSAIFLAVFTIFAVFLIGTIARNMSASWRARAAFMPAANRSHMRVLPSMSVNRNVNVRSVIIPQTCNPALENASRSAVVICRYSLWIV